MPGRRWYCPGGGRPAVHAAAPTSGRRRTGTYIQRCFGRSMYSAKAAERLIEQQRLHRESPGVPGCGLPGGTRRRTCRPAADSQQLFEQAAEQARLNRAAYAENSELYESALLRLTEQIRNCVLVHQQPEAVTARQGWLDGGQGMAGAGAGGRPGVSAAGSGAEARLQRGPAAGRLGLPAALSGDHRGPGVYPGQEPC